MILKPDWTENGALPPTTTRAELYQSLADARSELATIYNHKRILEDRRVQLAAFNILGALNQIEAALKADDARIEVLTGQRHKLAQALRRLRDRLEEESHDDGQ